MKIRTNTFSTMQEQTHTQAASEPQRSRTMPTITYRVRRGGAETLVLLHGVGSSSATWAELVPLLDDRYTLVMPDYRGHGASAIPTGPYALSDFVDDVVRLLDELHLPSVHVVGFSIGAIFAQALAIEYPERVSTLVLLNSIAGRTEEEKVRALERLDVIRESDPAVVARTSVDRWFTPEFIADRPDLVDAEVSIISATGAEAYAASYHVLATTDLIDSVARITCPVLLITGERDRGSTPRMSREIQSRVAGAELLIIDGRQHYLHIEVAQLIADQINGFVRSHPTPHH